MRTKLYLAVDSAHFFLFHPDDCPDAAGQIAPPDEALAALVWDPPGEFLNPWG